jgi:malonyl-CoA O-methyltransferase
MAHSFSSRLVMASPQSPSKLSAPIDLARVRQLFSAPAKVAGADFLRREIAARMHERRSIVKAAPARILDAACGAGADLAVLQEAYPAAHVLGLDASAPMLANGPAQPRSFLGKLLPSKRGTDRLCADFGNLPLGPNSVDLVWSNLGLFWHPLPDRVFAEWRRVLRVDGLLMFSSFGPDTLKELREAGLHTLPFVDMHDFGDQLVEAGFSTPVMDMEKITVTYSDVKTMMADVRALGGNPLDTRPRGLMSRSRWHAVNAALERQRKDGKLTLTFEVIYGHAFRPAPKTTSSGEAIIRFQPRR